MLSVDVQKVTLMCLGENNTIIIDVDLDQIRERAQKYTHFYILISLTLPILIQDTSQTITIQKQFIEQVRHINTTDYILRNLMLEWPGQLDKMRLEEVLKGRATVQFFNISHE